ncbi:MAG: restriction endonuclease subunit S [Mameliella sp.]|nr:restriction endonuclease subunit S [Mameliella sp.]
MKDAAQSRWETKSLGEVCKFIGGGTPSKQNAAFWGGNFPWVSPKDMKSEIVSDSIDHVTESAIDQSAAKRIPEGSLLIVVRSGILARTIPIAIAGRELTVNQDLKAIVPDKGLDRHFLAYFLRSAEGQLLDRVTRGATVHKLDMPVIKSLPIPLPPLEEQQRIVAVLDEAFEGLARACAHAEANLQNARELFNAELAKVFDVELTGEDRATFESITKDTLIGLVRSKKEQGPERGYDYAKMNNIGNDDRFVGPVLDRVDCTPEEASRFELRGGDFLFNTRNSRELVGKSCVVEADFQRPTVFNNNVMRVRFVSEVNSRFVALAFKSKLAKAQLEAMKSGTTNVVAIYHKSLKKLTLPMPSLEIQRTLVDRFEELDAAIQRLISSYSEQAEDTDELRQSLLNKAFAGELT